MVNVDTLHYITAALYIDARRYTEILTDYEFRCVILGYSVINNLDAL